MILTVFIVRILLIYVTDYVFNGRIFIDVCYGLFNFMDIILWTPLEKSQSIATFMGYPSKRVLTITIIVIILCFVNKIHSFILMLEVFVLVLLNQSEDEPETRPYTRPPVADGWAGAEMRVLTLSNSIITDRRTLGRSC